MWDLIVSVPDHCLSFYLVLLFFSISDSFGTIRFKTYLKTGFCSIWSRRHERRRICHYLLRIDLIKAILQFSNFGCCISKGSLFRFWIATAPIYINP